MDNQADTKETFLPNFCSREVLALILIMSELVVVMLTLATSDSWEEVKSQFVTFTIFVLWISLSNLFLLCSLRTFLNRFDNLVVSIITFVVIQLVTAIFTAVFYYLAQLTDIAIDWAPNWLVKNILRNVGVSMIATAIALRYWYVLKQWKLNVQAEARSRVIALQARIRPHFLFNSMNSIAALTRSDPEKAEESVEDLAELFRASLANEEQLCLADEFELTKTYLRIESLRIGERLKINWQLEQPLPNVRLPALTLQPLVENTIYHGIEKLPEGGTVSIKGTFSKKAYVIEITNPLPKDGDFIPHKGNQIALENVRQRLALAFNEQALLSAQPGDGYFKVIITIPLAT